MTTVVKTVGRYELGDAIGYGGMAVVYLARQIGLDRQVALKELRLLQAPDDPALAARFLREARVVGSLGHPNIVTVHEYFEHEGIPYIAMEFLRRGSLRPWVNRMTVVQVVGVLEGLLSALDHAERYSIVHRDLKPENLLVTDQGQVKVADYGIAKARSSNTYAFLTAAGTTVGTPTYMAPEQAMAQELGPTADLYSVGVMAYEMLVGQIPFPETDAPLALMMRHVNETIPSAHTVNPSVDVALSGWIDRLLVKDPAKRTQTADLAWDELEDVVLALYGSRWRRDARLMGTAELPASRPLTPAPFTATTDTPAAEPAITEPLEPEPAPDDDFATFNGASPPGAEDRLPPPPVAPPVPPAVAPEPVVAEPEPVSVEPEPVVAEPEPVAAEPEPVAVEPEPVVAEPMPPEPVAAEPDPVVAGTNGVAPHVDAPAEPPVAEPDEPRWAPGEAPAPIAEEPDFATFIRPGAVPSPPPTAREREPEPASSAPPATLTPPEPAPAVATPEPAPVAREPTPEPEPVPVAREPAPAPREPTPTPPEPKFETFRPQQPAEPPRVEPTPTPLVPEPVASVAPAPAPIPEPVALAATIAPTATPAPVTEPAPKRRPPKPPEPAGPADTGDAGRRRGLLAGAGALAVLAVVAVVLLTGGGGAKGKDTPAAKPAGPVTLRTADLALTLPVAWKATDVPKVPGLGAGDALAGGPSAGGYVAAELVPGTADPTLLPAPLLRRLKRAPKPSLVTLAGVKAYRYDSVQPEGSDAPLRMYAVLTTGGVATIACGAGPAPAACDRVAGTLSLRSAKGLAVGPSEKYGTVLDKTFKTLDARIADLGRRRGQADTVKSQAAVVQRFAAVYRSAGRSLGKGDLNPVDAGVNARLTTGFKAVAVACDKLAKALRNQDRTKAIRAARRALAKARAQLAAATTGLDEVGYAEAPPATPVSKITPRSLPKKKVAPAPTTATGNSSPAPAATSAPLPSSPTASPPVPDNNNNNGNNNNDDSDTIIIG